MKENEVKKVIKHLKNDTKTFKEEIKDDKELSSSLKKIRKGKKK